MDKDIDKSNNKDLQILAFCIVDKINFIHDYIIH